MFETAVYMITEAPVKDIVDVAVIAEAEGFDYFLLADEGMTRDVFVALTAIAMNTQRIQFGPAIVNPYTRHPVTSAVTVATLDELSGGRAFMGYGIGGSLVLGPLGIEIHRPVKVCREAMEITRKLYENKTVQYQGEFFSLKESKITFKVRQDLPILFGARGEKLLELGGELADDLLLSGVAKFDLQRCKDIIMQGARKTGRHPKIFYDAHVAYDKSILDNIKAEYTFMVVDSPPQVKEKLGLSDSQIEKIREVMTNEGIHKAGTLVTPEVLSHFIILGDDEACAREITRIMKEFEFQVFTVPIPIFKDPRRMVQRISSIIKRAKGFFSG